MSTKPVGEWSVGRIKPMPAEIPSSWNLVRLTDVAKLESGHTPSRRRPEYWDGGVPWVSLHDSDSLEGPEISRTALTISEEGLANSSARLLPAGTVVFSRTATVGKCTLLGREMATSQDFANYVCGPSVHNRYLVHLFRFMAPEWCRLMAGSTHNTVYMPVFRVLQVLLPPLHEQKAIAEALSDADALIESLEALIAKKRQIKQGAMQELLTGKRRLPGFSGEWETRRLGEIASFKTGPFGSSIKQSEYVANGVPVINPSHLIEGRIQEGELSAVPLDVARRLQDFAFATDDIAVGRRGDIGRSAYVSARESGWICGTGTMIVRPFEGDSRFLQKVLSSPAVVAAIVARSIGTTMLNLNQESLRGIVLRLPHATEQRAIAAVLSDLDAELEALETKLEKARALKQGMMQELLTGRTRLVPAEVS